jgi:hypothetical protein
MPSKTVFDLRKEAKPLSGIAKLNILVEALNLARKQYQGDPYDEWTQKALAYTLIDLCKYHLAENDQVQSSAYFTELCSIDFPVPDNIIEGQKNFLQSRMNQEVQQAEQFSKNGDHLAALDIFRKIIAENRFTGLHHEAYGWNIFRYIKEDNNNLSSIDVRTLLREYMNLRNERPSLLHSMILNVSLNYSKTHPDLRLYDFFKLWGPHNLREDDLQTSTSHEGQKIPSLISRLCREFVDKNISVNIEEDIVKTTNFYQETVVDYFREPFFWKLFNAHKEHKLAELWELFQHYNTQYAKYGSSKWHSEILGLAERFMKETDEFRFFNFLKSWGPENFAEEDWEEVKRDENTYKPLAVRAIKKAYETIKNKDRAEDLSWLIRSYDIAISKYPEDEWLLRGKALLLIKSNEPEQAIPLFKKLVLELRDKYYIWQNFADCIPADDQLRIGMLSKALSLERNEDFLGDIHVELARLLIKANLLENALLELEIYKAHREYKGWAVSQLFEELYTKVKTAKSDLPDNSALYKKYISLADEFAYADFEWTEAVLVNTWKDDNGKERLAFSNGYSIEFTVGKSRFAAFTPSAVGQIFRFKLYQEEIKKEVEITYGWGKKTIVEYRYTPLLAERTDKERWSILEETFAVVQYINIEKQIVHAITNDHKEVFFPQIREALKKGDFIKARRYNRKVKEETRMELKQIQRITKSVALKNFTSLLAIVDGVNEEKQLFHFTRSTKIQGIVKHTETDLRPREGDFINLYMVVRKDKEKKIRSTVLHVELTDTVDEALRKDIFGFLQVKFKPGREDAYDNETVACAGYEGVNIIVPDFAFINDYYVPKHLLKDHNITSDCLATIRVIFAGDKWKVIAIDKME